MRMLLRLIGFLWGKFFFNKLLLIFDLSTVKIGHNCDSYGKEFNKNYSLTAENVLISGTVNQDLYGLPICQ